MLEVDGISVSYGAVPALRNVSISVGSGEIVAVIGLNGAGKSSMLKAIQGLVRPTRGRVFFMSEEVQRLPPHTLVNRGLLFVPENRLLFPEMTVLENLELGAYPARARGRMSRNREWVYGLFPVLADRSRQKVQTLSGGEQQMLAIGRALMAEPSLLMLDEPSTGLAPLVVRELFRVIAEIHRQGVSVLLVEQNVAGALALAHRAYVLETGRVVRHGSAMELRGDPGICAAFLGDACAGVSFGKRREEKTRSEPPRHQDTKKKNV